MFAAWLVLSPSLTFPIVLERPKADGESMQIVALDGPLKPRPLFDGQYPSTSTDSKWVTFTITKWMPEETVVPGLWTQLFVRKTTKSLDPAIPLATYFGPVTLSMPMFSADDRQICYEVAPQRPTITDKQRGIYVVSSKGGKSRLIYTPQSKPARLSWPSWASADAKSVVLVDGPKIVWVNTGTKAATSRPSSWLLGDESPTTQISMLRPCPTDPDLYAYTTTPIPGARFEPRHSMVYVGRHGEAPLAISGTGNAWHPRWTADGKSVLFYRVAPGHDRADLVAYDVETHAETTLFQP